MSLNTDALRKLLELKLDRGAALTLHRQLRSAIEMAILLGDLPDGAQLPPVRKLAAALNIAPATVLRTYLDLQSEHLIKSVPRRGYFVSFGPSIDSAALDISQIEKHIDEALRASEAIGMDRQSFLRLVSMRIRGKELSQGIVAVVGLSDAALSERVMRFAEGIADLGMRVIGIAIEDLEAGITEFDQVSLSEIEYFLVSVGETQRAAIVLGPHASRILPWTRTLRDDVREFIASQPEFTRFGIIASSPDLVGRMVAMVRRIHVGNGESGYIVK